MKLTHTFVTIFFLVFSLFVPMSVWSIENVPISLTNPKRSGRAIEETVLDIPQTTSTPADIRKKKMELEEENYGEKTASKLGNGMLDIVTSILEIPKTIIKTTEEDGLVSGLTIGFVKGIANTAGQAVSGAVNVATFPVPVELENPMAPKKSTIEQINMEDEFGGAFE